MRIVSQSQKGNAAVDQDTPIFGLEPEDSVYADAPACSEHSTWLKAWTEWADLPNDHLMELLEELMGRVHSPDTATLEDLHKTKHLTYVLEAKNSLLAEAGDILQTIYDTTEDIREALAGHPLVMDMALDASSNDLLEALIDSLGIDDEIDKKGQGPPG